MGLFCFGHATAAGFAGLSRAGPAPTRAAPTKRLQRAYVFQGQGQAYIAGADDGQFDLFQGGAGHSFGTLWFVRSVE